MTGVQTCALPILYMSAKKKDLPQDRVTFMQLNTEYRMCLLLTRYNHYIRTYCYLQQNFNGEYILLAYAVALYCILHLYSRSTGTLCELAGVVKQRGIINKQNFY